MKNLLSSKNVQIISIVIICLIFILLFVTKGIPYGIKISTATAHEKGMSDAGTYSENILLIYNIILIVFIIILNILFCFFSKKKTIRAVFLICFIIFSLFIPVIAKNSYNITIAGRSKNISYSEKYNLIYVLTHK